MSVPLSSTTEPAGAVGAIVDVLGRALTDLRISVTDRCNFRCGYCMPRERIDSSSFLPRSEVLGFEEIVRVARLFVGLGTRKLRITGGEPLLRRDLSVLVEMLSELGMEMALTTNGVLLPKQAQALKLAGLDRITVSLDALDPLVFQRSSDAPGFSPRDVLAGIDAAQAAGLFPLKVNCVVRRGLNEDQILPLVRHFAGQNVIVRFIEYMDVGTKNGWDRSGVVTKAEILDILSSDGPYESLAAQNPSDVADRFLGPHGEVGIIASVSEPFCGDCSRARLSADGRVYGCLFARSGLDLKTMMRADHSDEDLVRSITRFWRQRSDRYSERRKIEGRDHPGEKTAPGSVHLPTLGARIEMSYIGG